MWHTSWHVCCDHRAKRSVDRTSDTCTEVVRASSCATRDSLTCRTPYRILGMGNGRRWWRCGCANARQCVLSESCCLGSSTNKDKIRSAPSWSSRHYGRVNRYWVLQEQSTNQRNNSSNGLWIIQCKHTGHNWT